MAWDVISILPKNLLDKNDNKDYFGCELEQISRYGIA